MVKTVGFVVVEPGHFHSIMPFRKQYDIKGLNFSNDVHVWHSPSNPFIGNFKKMTKKMSYNMIYHESNNPTDDMIKAGKGGDIGVLASQNNIKSPILEKMANSGKYPLVLVDKPWVLTHDQLESLGNTVDAAEANGAILEDLMTERYELGTMVQSMMMHDTNLFGILEQGTEDSPSMFKASTHQLDKTRMENPVHRPAAYFDTTKQGRGLADVNTHLVDMVFNMLSPDKPVTIDDIDLYTSMEWPTFVPQGAFERITQTTEHTPGLVYCNGQMGFRLSDKWHVGIQVVWDCVEGKDDGHYSVLEGTKARLEVEKGTTPGAVQQLYVTPKCDKGQTEKALDDHLLKLGNTLKNNNITYEWVEQRGSFKVNLPEDLYKTHFDHFVQVTERALNYLAGNIPYNRKREMTNLQSKYWLTTKAVQSAKR